MTVASLRVKRRVLEAPVADAAGSCLSSIPSFSVHIPGVTYLTYQSTHCLHHMGQPPVPVQSFPKKSVKTLRVSLFLDILSHTPFTSEGSNELTEGVGAVHPGVQLCDAPAQPARVSCSSPPHTHPLAPLARQEFLTLVILTKPLRPASIARIWGFDCAMCVCVRVVGACVYGMGAEVIG